MFQSFSSHLFVRQVNICILHFCLKFNSWCVLFIWFIYKSMLYKLVLYIILKNIQHIQSRYGSHIFLTLCPSGGLTTCYLPWACLGRWYGAFEFAFNVLLWYCQWTIVWNKTRRAIVHGGIVGSTWWAERLK